MRAFFYLASVAGFFTIPGMVSAQSLGFGQYGTTSFHAGYGTFWWDQYVGNNLTFGLDLDRDTGLDYRVDYNSGSFTLIDSGTSYGVTLTFMEFTAQYPLVDTEVIRAGVFGGFGNYDVSIEGGGLIGTANEAGLLYGVAGEVSIPEAGAELFIRYSLAPYLDIIPAFGNFYDVGAKVDLPLRNYDTALFLSHRVFDTYNASLSLGLEFELQ